MDIIKNVSILVKIFFIIFVIVMKKYKLSLIKINHFMNHNLVFVKINCNYIISK
jgi:hypothetical protein